MLRFDNDYMEGAHPAVLQRLSEINFEQNSGYGCDDYCARAKARIRAACACPQAEIFFLSGGTQTNATFIKALLRPYQGVLAAETGHINGHEAGAIEATGHKVLALPQKDGKLTAEAVETCLHTLAADPARAHCVQPGLVYVSHPTELGTLYTQAELGALRAVCDRYGLPLYLDGARLGYGLATEGTDVDLPFLAQCCDAFYIGGTKVGALFGEALVLTRPGLLPHLFTMIKQQGALLAKGWLMGVQFDALFTDGRYQQIGRHALTLANRLKTGFAEKGYPFFIDSPTNQIFVVLERAQWEALSRQVSFTLWEELDARRVVARFVTSWATRPEDVDALLAIL